MSLWEFRAIMDGLVEFHSGPAAAPPAEFSDETLRLLGLENSDE